MNFNEYMKKAREKQNLTQESAAQLLGVTATTIQNWEKNILPDKNFWNIIIDIYKLDKNEFIITHGNSVIPQNNIIFQKREIPKYLFLDEDLEIIKNLVLTEDEQELLGLMMIYDNTTYHTSWEEIKDTKQYGFVNIPNKDYIPNSKFSNLPYEYVKNMGSFKIISLYNQLITKLDKYKNLVIKYLTNNYNQVFDIGNLSDSELLEFSKCTDVKKHISVIDELTNEEIQVLYDKVQVYRLTERNDYTQYTIEKFGKYEYKQIEDSKVGFLNDNWYKLYEVAKKCPKYIKIIQEQDENYIKEKQQYKEDIMRYMDDDKDIVYKPPQKPREIINEYITLTEEGKQLVKLLKGAK